MILQKEDFLSMDFAPSDGTVVLLFHHCMWYRPFSRSRNDWIKEGVNIQLARFIEGHWEAYPGVMKMRSSDRITQPIGWLKVDI